MSQRSTPKVTHALLQLLAFALAFGLALISRADPPLIISYQGQLTSPSGAPREGSVTMVVAIYSVATNGSSLYRETQSNVALQNGTFNLQIGTGTSKSGSLTTATDGPDAFLQLTVAGEVMTPRLRLSSAPYSLSANNAATLSQKTQSEVIAIARGPQGSPGPTGPVGPPGPAYTAYAYCSSPISYNQGASCYPAVPCDCGQGTLILSRSGTAPCNVTDEATGAFRCHADPCTGSGEVSNGYCCVCSAQ